MNRALIPLILSGLWAFMGESADSRPQNVPSSAAAAGNYFIECAADKTTGKNRCTVYDGKNGEIISEGLFALVGSHTEAGAAELHPVDYVIGPLFRGIRLRASGVLSLEEASDRDPRKRLINDRLKALSSGDTEQVVNCGATLLGRPEAAVSECASSEFREHKPFYAWYYAERKVPNFSYGLAGDKDGSVFEIVYDIRGLLNLGLSRNSQVFNDNQIRVTKCINPITLGKTQEGMLACVTPINQAESAIAAKQKPIETTVCDVAKNPFAFNNKPVRIRGHVSGNFEYSMITEDACSDALWFVYGTGASPSGLVAHIPGGATAGAEDFEGKQILPVPVTLVRDANFKRFEKLMKSRVKADAASEKMKPDDPLYHRVTATFIGRVDGVSPEVHEFHSKRKANDMADYLGFGQMGQFDAELVLQSVDDDAVIDAKPSGASSH